MEFLVSRLLSAILVPICTTFDIHTASQARPPPAPSGCSAGAEGQPGDHCIHGYPGGVCHPCGSGLPSISSVSSISLSTGTSAARTSTPGTNFTNIGHTSGACSCCGTQAQDSTSHDGGSSRAPPGGVFPSREMLAGWDQIHKKRTRSLVVQNQLIVVIQTKVEQKFEDLNHQF